MSRYYSHMCEECTQLRRFGVDRFCILTNKKRTGKMVACINFMSKWRSQY